MGKCGLQSLLVWEKKQREKKIPAVVFTATKRELISEIRETLAGYPDHIVEENIKMALELMP
jgi:hypothetical protein